MKRKLVSLVALVLLAASLLAFPAAAAEPAAAKSNAMPRYVNVSVFTASIDITSSGKAMCYAYVKTADPNYTISMNMALQRYANGGWSTVKSWTSSGTGSVTMDKSYYITGDYYYHTAATATVWDEDGHFVEGPTIYSQSYYYAD